MGDVREATAALAARLREIGVVPVVELPRHRGRRAPRRCAPRGRALLRRDHAAHPGAVEGISAIRAAYPDILLGAGTVLSVEQVDIAIAAGADFAVAPGTNPQIVRGEPRARPADPPGRRDAQRDRDCQSARDLTCSSSSRPSCSEAPRTCARSAGPTATSRSSRRGRSRRRRCPATSRCRRCSPAAAAGWSSPR